MRNMSLITTLLLFVLSSYGQGQSPHGDNMGYSCGDCHNTLGWDINMDSIPFNHDATTFKLEGQHAETNCLQCHESLVFSEAEPECFSCHQDVHETTVGFECQRCHNNESWLVENITEIHQQNRFPLVGGHITADCYDCHDAASLLRFDPLGVECVDCHREEYLATTEPNHQDAGYPTDCQQCHLVTSFEWSAEGFNHSFFPLEKGHDIADCNECHEPGQPYEAIDATCFSCHEQDYNNSANPAHLELGFSTDCEQCHDLSRAWRPASYRSHDAEFFPIYSGEHQGEWDNCSECHPNPANYAEFTCISCHEHNEGEMNDEHDEVNGYVYNSPACLACHPSGSGEGEDFNHDKTGFPLEGEHRGADCTSCHADGYEGTSSYCADCHQQEFDEAANPSHTDLGLSDDCALCHEPTPEWEPATFANHNEYYMIEGAHTEIANNCDECHDNDYINTPNTCYGCHEQDYTETNDPSHTAAQFSTDCETCHTQVEWEPATFDHDGQYFPIYSGEHQGEWDDCSECHPSPDNYAEFTCISCHEHNQTDTDEEHNGISGYVYNNQACLECHPDGSGEGAFDHNTTNFPLTGAHLSSSCLDCHADGYEGTSTYCADCHTADFNATTNPNHNELALSDDCATCHSTEPGWEPATFANHNDYYVLEGAHASIANSCTDCHEGDYLNTPNTCFGCHETDYNQTTDPDHSAANFPTNCEECHTQGEWEPATFDHDGQYFPIYSGEHQGEWDNCSECHPNPNNYLEFSCFECHPQGETDDEHSGISGYVYESNACLECHPDGSGEGAFDHSTSNFPLTGAHTTVGCEDCHANGYGGTSTYCADCHTDDFNSTTNPNHNELALSDDCATCHSTEPGWEPASFANHNDYYVLEGAHANIANQCDDCHSGDYITTPNTCFGCHETDYNQTTDPNHGSSGFATECTECHGQFNWSNISYPLHDGLYFPVYSGEHQGEWDHCSDCHPNPNSYAEFSCFACHPQGEMDSEHNDVSGYVYESTACLDCHPNGGGDQNFMRMQRYDNKLK